MVTDAIVHGLLLSLCKDDPPPPAPFPIGSWDGRVSRWGLVEQSAAHRLAPGPGGELLPCFTCRRPAPVWVIKYVKSAVAAGASAAACSSSWVPGPQA